MISVELFVARLLRELAEELEWFWFADEFLGPVEWPTIPTGESDQL